jgi:hypothetical protein
MYHMDSYWLATKTEELYKNMGDFCRWDSSWDTSDSPSKHGQDWPGQHGDDHNSYGI